MKKQDIAPQYADVLTTQAYGTSAPIEGVSFIPLKYHGDDTGEFTELGRFINGRIEALPSMSIAQISVSVLLPGTVKAFHLHFDQTDVWYVSPHERLLVGLLDTRKSSPTASKTMRFILGGGVAQLLVIPSGVAHGAANVWNKPVTMTYFTDQKFDSKSPDERRLPYDLFGEDFWRLKKG